MMSVRAKACYEKFKENVALAARIESQLPNDKAWSCVVRFYAALHLLNAYLIDKPQVRFDPGSTEHTERKKAIDHCPELRDAPKRYRQLKDISESVRYDAGFTYTDEHQKIVQAHLDKIIGIVDPKIKKA
jgi:hypothetical protein